MNGKEFLTKLGDFEGKIWNIMTCFQQDNYGLEIRSSDILLTKTLIGNLVDFLKESYVDKVAHLAIQVGLTDTLDKNDDKPTHEYLDEVIGILKSIREKVSYNPEKWILGFTPEGKIPDPAKIRQLVENDKLFLPEKITLHWISQNAPIAFWLKVAGIASTLMAGSFMSGKVFGNLTAEKPVSDEKK